MAKQFDFLQLRWYDEFGGEVVEHFADTLKCVVCGTTWHRPARGKNPRTFAVFCEPCFEKGVGNASSKDAPSTQQAGISSGRKTSS